MTQDQFQEPPRDPPGPGRMVVAGVVGACVLGVALGFWARPGEPGEPSRKVAAPASPPRPALQIVVADTPDPIGRPLEVLPSETAGSAAVSPPSRTPVEPMVPRRPASGLVKVDAPVAPQTVAASPAPKPKVKPAPRPKVDAVVAPPKPDPWLAEAKIARAVARKAAEQAAERAEARAEKLDAARAVKLAKAEKVEKAARAEHVRSAKLEAQHAKAVKIEAKAKSEARSRRLAALLKAVKAQARQVVRPKAVQVAEVKPHKPAPKAVTLARAAPPPPLAAHAAGPMRVARANPCVLPDPGEAAVCADSRLGARDRQLQQAYRNAEAAGVPASALHRQQARWLQARAAAAREAPWAVEDVYVARISELKDQTRDAHEN
ncbi:hypothetical protein [Phenylobacterium sp.]|uniref:hypothetical protein n=1 Tax=Phenylobacterium sp. TaxID=1871053 RepID=UPI0025D38298|nr:hypothetical protein [Phenylobacterium sp.]